MRNILRVTRWISVAAFVGCLTTGPSFALNSQQSLDDVARAKAHIVTNANQCAPDQAKAVWSSDSRLLGYRCYYNPNGA